MPARLPRAVVIVAVVLVSALVAAPAAMAARPGYLTIMLDRSQLVQADAACGPQAGSVPMPDVLAEIARRGMVPTGSVVTSFVNETTVGCKKPALYPSWADLQAWHTQYGLELVSSGATKAKFNQIDAAHQWSESCGTLPAFQVHGFSRAWRLFNYPNDSWTLDAQSSVVGNCFAWGRDYANKINTRSGQASPWFGYVKQLVGGSATTRHCPVTTRPSRRASGTCCRPRSPSG